MSEWISVAELRPERGQILCCGPMGGRFIGAYKGGYTVDENDRVSCLAWDTFAQQPRRFVYWMLLPEPPPQEAA